MRFRKDKIFATGCRDKRFAAVVSIYDLEFLEELEDRVDAEDYNAALKSACGKPTVTWGDLKRKLNL